MWSSTHRLGIDAADARDTSRTDQQRQGVVLIRAPWGHWLRPLPAALLILVATHQIVLAHTSGMSAWTGGGFGMFASTDAGGRRHLHAFVLRPGIRRELRPARASAERVQRTLSLPSDRNLRALAAEIAEIPTPDHGPPTAVELQVWRVRFDPQTLAPAGLLLRSLEVPVAVE